MCQDCAGDASRIGRRRLLAFAGAAAISLGLPRMAAAAAATPKPENVLSADAALDRLMAGNGRYVDGSSRRHDFRHERETLTKGQNPFAAILGCADSRISPDYAFDTGRGDLFVCRMAGNFASEEVIASFEYAVQQLHTPLLMVLGHQSCGAVEAVLDSLAGGPALPGHMSLLADAIGPAAQAALRQPGNRLDTAIAENVHRAVDRLKTATPILSRAVQARALKVVGALYHLGSGRVTLLA